MGEMVDIGNEIICARMGNTSKNILNKAGDDVRIDWGYFYFAAKFGSPQISIIKNDGAKLLIDKGLH